MKAKRAAKIFFTAIFCMLALTVFVSASFSGTQASGSGLGKAASISGEQLKKSLEKYGRTVDIDKATNGQKLPYDGYYYGELTAGGTTRVWKEYFPKGYELQTYQVALTVPEGEDTEDFLAKSGWIDVANSNGLALFVMEPLNKAWGTVDDEKAYIEAAFAKRTGACISSSTYVVGYDKGGSALQKHIMDGNAISVAGAAFINASEIDSQFLAGLDKSTYVIRPKPLVDSGIKYTEVPVPVWIIDANITGGNTVHVINYWKKANEYGGTSAPFHGGTIYYQVKNTRNEITPKGNVASVAVLKYDAKANAQLAKMIYDNFLSLTTRYGGVISCNVVAPRPDYKKLGVEFGGIMDQGYRRDYMVYVPAAVKVSGKAAPVVFILGGANQGYKAMFDLTRWWEVADKYGIIIVATSSTVGRTSVQTGTSPGMTWVNLGDARGINEGFYFDALIKDLSQKYKMDAGRLYLHGQSNGGTGVSVASGVMPQMFAAVGSTTGLGMGAGSFTSEDAFRKHPATYYLAGEFDGTANEYYATNTGLITWLQKIGVNVNKEGTQDLASDLNVSKIVLTGRHVIYKWLDKNGVPLHCATVVRSRGHSLLPANIWLMWEDGFSHWSRGANGELIYNGK